MVWPRLQLTDYEKQYVGIYAEPDARAGGGKPGVLRRCYPLQLANKDQRTKNIPGVKTINQIQISRRARVFAITFSGNTDAWRLSVRNTNGTMYTNPTPRGQKFPVVSSLIVGSYYNALALGGRTPPLRLNNAYSVTEAIGPNVGMEAKDNVLQGMQSMPWIIEPNWICQPNETIIFEGTDVSPQYEDPSGQTTIPMTGAIYPTVLNISLYVWEFPGMSV